LLLKTIIHEILFFKDDLRRIKIINECGDTLMDGVTVPFLPTAWWLGSVICLVGLGVIGLSFMVFYQRRLQAALNSEGDVADLEAKKVQLKSDVNVLEQWITTRRAELERLHAEREEQEVVRAELQRLEQQCATKEQENQLLRNEVGELENQRHALGQTLNRLQRDIGDLEAQRAEAKLLEQRLGELREQCEDARQVIRSASEAQVRLEVLLSEKSSLERISAELRAEVDRLETVLHEKTKDAEAAREEFQVLTSQLNSSRSESGQLEVRVNGLRHEQSTLENNINNLELRCREEEQYLSTLAQQTTDSKEKADAVNRILAELETSIAERNRELDHCKSSIDSINTRKALLEREVEQIIDMSDERKDALAELSSQIVEVRDDYELAKKQLSDVDSSLSERYKELDRCKEGLSAVATRKAVLEREIEKLEERVGGQSPDSDNKFVAYSDLLEREPVDLSKMMFSRGVRDRGDEAHALQQLKDELRGNGLKFSSRVINAFHTSLKCHDINPLTVLAGVSGTGKTLLPVCYARMMGMHSMVMAVQPRWDSPQDMFGFYNYLEKQYKATELSRALVRMDPYNYPNDTFPSLNSNWVKDRMLLVLLDEMNLARTEYYFSEFLSKLELRRLVNDSSRSEDRKAAEIELDAGPSKDLRFRLWVNGNVLFVGTMNEDETTQTLSDKVLDRSNVIRFGKPEEQAKSSVAQRIEVPFADQFLSYKQWQSWHREYDGNVSWADDVRNVTNKLNSALDSIGRPFGYRVEQAFCQYVSNYPRVDEENRHKLALADQVEQKILPKLRGVDFSDSSAMRCLNDVADVITEIDDIELIQAFQRSRDESESGLFQWRGVTRKVDMDF
jgi:predicted  nucleic acid-binding Zn-ribbon protein